MDPHEPHLSQKTSIPIGSDLYGAHAAAVASRFARKLFLALLPMNLARVGKE